ncbi:MAG: type II toxin-antitoxin system BrnA family antitoxin [Allorhizobium sp.]|uniref:type II toxin-antitoxin system BrnA family antitoxin n=1 Tax=Allorhizobium sp. TaxID=633478 RepID=UPI004033AD9C
MKTISAEELDRLFDEGEEDVLQYFDLTTARRPNLEPVELTVTVMLGTKLRLERQAKALGVSVDSLLEDWLREKLDAARSSAAE